MANLEALIKNISRISMKLQTKNYTKSDLKAFIIIIVIIILNIRISQTIQNIKIIPIAI